MEKAKQSFNAKASRPLSIALFIALAVGALLLKNYASLIIVAIILAFLFNPVYKKLQKRFKRNSMAASITLLITILAIGIPVIAIIAVTIVQASTMISDVSSAFTSQDINKLSTEILNWINQFVGRLTGGRVTVTDQDIANLFSQIVTDLATFILDTLKSWVGSLGSVVTNSIIYMYLFTGILVYQDKLIKLVKQLNPLGEDITDIYMSRAGNMTKAMIRGQFIIAVIQGTESAAVLHLTGLPYFAFFVLLLTFLSIIPLGAGILTIPIGIVNILFGNYWQGFVILLNHFIIVTNIDNVLKPKLVPKSVRLHPALLLIATFAGIGIFGFLGIIAGPVIMILITTTIEVYLKVTGRKVKTT